MQLRCPNCHKTIATQYIFKSLAFKNKFECPSCKALLEFGKYKFLVYFLPIFVSLLTKDYLYDVFQISLSPVSDFITSILLTVFLFFIYYFILILFLPVKFIAKETN